MSGPGGLRPGFDPDELRGGDGPDASDAELGHAWAMARELGSAVARDGGPVEEFGLADGGTGAADPDFVARVMAAIEREPAPRSSAVVAGNSARLGIFSAGLAAFRDAWRVAFGPGRSLVGRAGALAYVVVALAVLGSAASVAVVGTASLLSPDGTSTPTPLASQPAAVPGSTLVPGRSLAPGETHTPGASAEPASSAGPGEPTAPDASGLPAATDDRRGRGSDDPTLGPGQTASPSPSGSPDGSHAPKPTPTATPTGTPRATSPNSGGGGGGGGGSTATPTTSPGATP